MHRSPARWMAPLALLLVVFVVFSIVSSGDSGSDKQETTTKTQQTTARKAPTGGKRSYTVKTGDTLSGIAERTGVTVVVLQRLNPKLDPQTLRVGQKLKLVP